MAFTPTTSGKTVVQENAYYPFGGPIADLSYSAPLNTNRYKHTGMETISDFGLGYVDNAARWRGNPFSHPMFLSIDPLAEKYPWVSPYAYCNNNPVRFVDPTGETWYEVNENGFIVVMKDPDGNILGKKDKFDMLYAKGKEDVKPIRVNDQSILPTLSESKSIKVATGFSPETGTIVEEFQMSTYSTKNNADEKTANEITNLFYFLADNSSKSEWRLHKTKQGAFGLGTYHASDDAPSDKDFGLSYKDIQMMIHSHIDSKRSVEAERKGFGTDRAVAQYYSIFRVYIPSSRRIYTIDKYGQDKYRTR